jgi:hypothetical protein
MGTNSQPAFGELARERAALSRLTSPQRIQEFLDGVAYTGDPIYRSPRSVIRDRRAHCLDGALLAAAALRRLGHPPLLVDLRAVRDDDHVIAVFRRRGRLGAIAKSNFVGLRFREPIFRSIRELALSYFEPFYNIAGEKTLRAYSVILDLRSLGRPDWTVRDEAIDPIARKLDSIRHYAIAPPEAIAELSSVDPRSYRAGLVGVNEAGLYRPQGSRRLPAPLE